MSNEENELIDGVDDISHDDESTDKFEGLIMVDKEWIEGIESKIAAMEVAPSHPTPDSVILQKISEILTKLSEMESRINAVEQRIKMIPASGKVSSGWPSIKEFMNDELNRVFIENYCEEKNWDIDELGHNEQKEIYRAKITKKD